MELKQLSYRRQFLARFPGGYGPILRKLIEQPEHQKTEGMRHFCIEQRGRDRLFVELTIDQRGW